MPFYSVVYFSRGTESPNQKRNGRARLRQLLGGLDWIRAALQRADALRCHLEAPVKVLPEGACGVGRLCGWIQIWEVRIRVPTFLCVYFSRGAESPNPTKKKWERKGTGGPSCGWLRNPLLAPPEKPLQKRSDSNPEMGTLKIETMGGHCLLVFTGEASSRGS